MKLLDRILNFISDLLSNQGDLRFDKRVHGPVRLAATKTEDEVAQHIDPDQRVGNFGMKLHRHHRFLLVTKSRKRAVTTHGAGFETIG